MITILNIITNPINREGITTTQLEYVKRINNGPFDVHIDIAVVTNKYNSDVINEFQSYGCRIIFLPDRNKTTIKYFLHLVKLLQSEEYGVVHVHGSSSLMAIELVAAQIAKVPIRIAHSRNTTNKHPMLDSLLKPIFLHSYSQALACGKEAGEFLFRNRPFTIFHNGKDFSKFRFNSEIRKSVRQKYDLVNHTVVGFVGNLIDQKNTSFFLEVTTNLVKQNPLYKIVVIGDGVNKDSMEKSIADSQLNDHFLFLGRINNVNELLNGMDIMLLPSKYEGLPNVVLEWQISGLPSIVSDRVTKECAVTNLVDFLPIDKGSDIWTNQIKKNNTEPRDRELISEQACEKMKKAGFEINESVQHLIDIYKGTV